MSLKNEILSHLKSALTRRIQETELSLKFLRSSRDDESKSSMGDKYETGREMIGMEMEKTVTLLNQLAAQIKVIDNIDISLTSDKIKQGSLVRIKNEYYFLALGYGTIEIDQKKCYVISAASPIGQLMIGRQAGEQFTFRGKDYLIESIN